MIRQASRGTPHDMLRLVFRKRALLLLGASVFAVATMTGSLYLPLKYVSKATFEFGLEAAAAEISRASERDFGTIKERLGHDLTGEHAVEKAIRQLHLTEGMPHDSEGRLTFEGRVALQGMVRSYISALEVIWEARSKQEDLVSVSFTNSDPDLAQNLPNVLVKDYINSTYDRIRSGLKRQYDFLKTKVVDAARKLDVVQREKIDFEAEHAGTMPADPEAFQEKMERTRVELLAAKQKHEAATLKLARLNAMRPGTTSTNPTIPSTIIRRPNPEIPYLQAKLVDLLDELDTGKVTNHMTEQHPTIKALRLRIAQMEKRIEETPKEIIKERVFSPASEMLDVSMTMASVQSQLGGASNEIARLEGLQADYEVAWANVTEIRHEYLSLAQKVTDCQGETGHWRERLAEVQIALAAAMDNRLTRLKAVHPAQRQFLPSSPALQTVLAMAGLGGLAFGAGLVFLSKVFDRTINSAEEASDYFSLSVHGVIGEIATTSHRFRRGLRRWLLRPLACVIMLAALSLSATAALMRLRFPQKYQQMRESPVQFLQDHTLAVWKRIPRP